MTVALVVLALGALGGGIAAWPARRRRPPVPLPHRPPVGTTASPRRHRAVEQHTGSISATEILARLTRGEDPLG